MLHFGNNFNAQPALDSDGDGVSNFDEWLAHTDPRDPESLFNISAVRHENGVTHFEFQSSPIRRYQAQRTPDLDTPFTTFLGIDGTGGIISVVHTNGSGGFYRLQAEAP
jgi:hypothetical protein